jgi:hypothetical protein
MTEHEDLTPGPASLRVPLNAQMIASFALPQQCDCGSAPLPFRRNHPAEAVHLRFVEAR